jgi:hypothetical protein
MIIEATSEDIVIGNQTQINKIGPPICPSNHNGVAAKIRTAAITPTTIEPSRGGVLLLFCKR